jgi:hypothetical protein
MSVNEDEKYLRQDKLEFRTRQPVRAIDWYDFCISQNHVHSRTGQRVSSITFVPPFTTTSEATYVRTVAANTRQLAEYNPVFRPIKFNSSATDQVFRLDVAGSGYQIRLDIENLRTGASTIRTFIKDGSTPEWQTFQFTLLKSFVWSGQEPGEILIKTSIRKRAGFTNSLYHLSIRSEYGSFPTTVEHAFPVLTFVSDFLTDQTASNLGYTSGEAEILAGSRWPEAGELTSIGDGQWRWTVPWDGNFRVEAAGAGFNGVSNQKGAVAGGDFYLYAGEVLRIAVGRTGNGIRQGSGGTFVCKEVPVGGTLMLDGSGARIVPLVVAGGAGGTNTSNSTNIGGRGNLDGAGNPGLTNGILTTVAINGNGGAQGLASAFATSGAGIFGNGTTDSGSLTAAQSFTRGSKGNFPTTLAVGFGGFGGGGSGRATSNWRLGGGGGYSGGGSGGNASTDHGGGGGTFVATTAGNRSSTAAFWVGNGAFSINTII